MHGGVTAGAPTAPEPEPDRVIEAPNENAVGIRGIARSLGVAFQTQIVVALDEHRLVDRAVRVVTDRAAFAHGFVFKDEWLGLFAMTLGAGLIEPRHGEAAGGFHHVAPMRVVALHAIHFAFDDRMMLRQVEFGVGLEMTLKAGRCVLAGIDDELVAATANRDVLAAGTVAGLAPAFTLSGQTIEAQPRMRTGDKGVRVVGVTFETGAIADERRAFNGRRRKDGAFDGGTGNQRERAGEQGEHNPSVQPRVFHNCPRRLIPSDVMQGWFAIRVCRPRISSRNDTGSDSRSAASAPRADGGGERTAGPAPACAAAARSVKRLRTAGIPALLPAISHHCEG